MGGLVACSLDVLEFLAELFCATEYIWVGLSLAFRDQRR